MSSLSNAMPHVEGSRSRKLAEASATGELETAESYGKPLQDMDAWAIRPRNSHGVQGPQNSGFAPPEMLLFHEQAALAEQIKSK